MFLRSLRQFGFRNLETSELTFGEGVTAIVGANAAGKSNLLDACYLASSGDLPTGRLGDALRWGQPEGFVAAQVERSGGDRVHLHVGLAPGRKILRLDEQPARVSDVARVSAAVRITPEDADMIHGGPSLRRGWLDDVLRRLSRRYGALLREYGKVLEQRNAGLRADVASAYLDVFSDRLAVLGDEIEDLRARILIRVHDVARSVYHEVAGGKKELSVALEPSQGDRPLREALAASASEERARGVTVVGPHRDDLAVHLDGRSVQTFGSRGEARTAAMALRVAELRLLEELHGEPPILLLDDFSAELDADRRTYLLSLSERLPQALVSGTEPPPHAARILKIAAGVVRADG